MAAKVTALVLTILINLVLGVAVFFFLLLAMNGYSGSDAEPGLITYVALGVTVSIMMGIGAFVLTGYLIKRGTKMAVAPLIAVPAFSVLGGVFKIVAAFAAIMIAEYVRVNY